MSYKWRDRDPVPELESTFWDPSQRTPCVLVLDTSSSMRGAPIEELNMGLMAFKQALMEDTRARRQVDVATVTFGDRVRVLHEYVTAEAFAPPQLTARGHTPMGEAVHCALDGVAAIRSLLSQSGTPLASPPWVFLITDGAPTDSWKNAAERVHREVAARQVYFHAFDVQRADMHLLTQIAAPDCPPFQLQNLDFQTLFRWLSDSLSRSQPALLPPGGTLCTQY